MYIANLASRSDSANHPNGLRCARNFVGSKDSDQWTDMFTPKFKEFIFSFGGKDLGLDSIVDMLCSGVSLARSPSWSAMANWEMRGFSESQTWNWIVGTLGMSTAEKK